MGKKFNADGVPNTIKNGDRVEVHHDPLSRNNSEGTATVINVVEKLDGNIYRNKVKYFRYRCKVKFDDGLVTHRVVLAKK